MIWGTRREKAMKIFRQRKASKRRELLKKRRKGVQGSASMLAREMNCRGGGGFPIRRKAGLPTKLIKPCQYEKDGKRGDGPSVQGEEGCAHG